MAEGLFGAGWLRSLCSPAPSSNRALFCEPATAGLLGGDGDGDGGCESDTAAGGEVTGGDALMIATGDALDDQIPASRTHKCLSLKDPLDHSDHAHTNQESPLHRSLHSQHCTRRHIRRRRHR